MEQASDAREASQTRMPDTVLPSFRENFRDIIEEAGQTDRLGQHIANYVAAYEGKRTELRLLKEENAKLRKENRELWHDNRALHEDREEMRANWNAGNMNELRAKDEQIATLQRVRDRLQESQRAKDEKIGMLQQVVEKGTSRDEKIMILRQLNEKQSQDMTKKDLEINRLEWKMVEKNAELNTMWENLRRQF
jgi:hypothetical protein